MKKIKTKYTYEMGEVVYPIYLVVKTDKTPHEDARNYTTEHFDLYCEREIPAISWYTVWLGSVNDYLDGFIQ